MSSKIAGFRLQLHLPGTNELTQHYSGNFIWPAKALAALSFGITGDILENGTWLVPENGAWLLRSHLKIVKRISDNF